MSNRGKTYAHPISLWPLSLEDALWAAMKPGEKMTATDRLKVLVINAQTSAYRHGHEDALSAIKKAVGYRK